MVRLSQGKEPMELCSTIIIVVHANKLSKKVKKISQRLAVGHAKKKQHYHAASSVSNDTPLFCLRDCSIVRVYEALNLTVVIKS